MVYPRINDGFWAWLKLIQSEKKNNVKVIAFAAYGSAIQRFSTLSTPCSFGAYLGTEVMFASEAEIRDYVEKFNNFSNGLIPNFLVSTFYAVCKKMSIFCFDFLF